LKLWGQEAYFLHKQPIPPVTHPTDTTRLDKWLWAARFYKTRQIAADAIKGGHVSVNGARAKPARAVKVGDRISLRKAPFDFEIEVLRLGGRRVAASEAQNWYLENPASIEKRRQLRQTLRGQARQMLYDTGKPGKRDRRHARDRKRGE